jgi:hypothetical protein
MMPYAIAALYPIVLVTALFVSLTQPPVPHARTLAAGAPPKNVQPGECDFGREGGNVFRCGYGTGVVVQTADGQRVEVPGPMNITFGKL